MRKINFSSVLEIPFDDSAWRLRLRREGRAFFFDLHWGDKEVPTHSVAVSVEDLQDNLRKMGFALQHI